MHQSVHHLVLNGKRRSLLLTFSHRTLIGFSDSLVLMQCLADIAAILSTSCISLLADASMRVYRAGTDLEVEFIIQNGDEQYDEYIKLGRPTSNNDSDPTKECYIAVTAGDQIQVAGLISGTVYQARCDLLIDGAFMGARVVEPPKQGHEIKPRQRKRIDFKTVTFIEATQHASDGARLMDGQLFVVPLSPKLDASLLLGNGQTYGVGTIVVMISIEQEVTPGYARNDAEFPDCTAGGWAGRDVEVRDPGILPTHSLEVRNTTELLTHRANPLQRHLRTACPGYKPFAKLIFHYRSKEALIKAAVMPSPLRSYPVQPEKNEDYAISSPPPELEDDSKDMIIKPTAYIPIRKANRSEESSVLSWDKLICKMNPKSTANRFAGQAEMQWTEQERAQKQSENEDVIIEIHGKDYLVPSARIICEMIPEHGMRIKKLLRILMPDLPKRDRLVGAQLFLLSMREHVALRNDQHLNLIVVKRCNLKELRHQSDLIQEVLARQHAAEATVETGFSGMKRATSMVERVAKRAKS